MDKKLQVIKDFVEGKISFDVFIDFLKQENALIEKIENEFDEVNLINRENYSIFDKDKIHTIFCRYLNKNKITFNPTNDYLKLCQDYYSIIPDWLPDSAQDWVEENILNKLPDDLSKTKKSKIVKEEINKVFPCRTRKPSWVQGTEDWPTDSDGNNLTFVKQIEDGDQVTYIFENEKTKEQIKIIEYY